MERYSTIEDLVLLSESALESSLAGFWDWDMVSNEEYLSPRFKQMLGYADNEMENKPESWQKIAFQEDLQGMFGSFEEHVKSGGKVPFNSIVRYHHKDGKTIWVRCNGKVVEWSDEGAPLRAIGCHVDITEEKQMEQELKKAVRERDTLLKEVHHRVKNNLQLLLSLSRLKDKKGKIQTQEIEHSINSIAAVYEAIYQSEILDKIPIQLYLEKIVKPIVNEREVSYRIDSIDYQQNIDFLIPIGLITTELVNNTLKHGKIESESLEIVISVSKEDELLSINYKDNGIGYGDGLTSIKENNSVGMSIINGLADQLDGSIQFYDEDGACAKLEIDLDACHCA
ncbi:MAG: PAS domain-containing protein [Crocinitomicaceae bacterium]